jgi:2EXR family
MIWKFAHPEARVIKLSTSKKQNHDCPYHSLVSRVPVPGILQACTESRQVALLWYRLLFKPVCGYGGTYFDTERDYMYYEPKERRLLTGSNLPVHQYSWTEDKRIWAEDRKCISNIVVHYRSRAQGSVGSVVSTLLELAKSCNEYTREVMFLGPQAPELQEGNLLSDLMPHPEVFESVWYPHQGNLDRFLQRTINFGKQLVPAWKNFEPRKLVCVALIATHNMN